MKRRVRIIAPAGRDWDDSVSVLNEGKDLLEKNGFEVSIQDDIFSDPVKGYYANTAEKRLEGLRAALTSDDCDIIWCFRGGYGSCEIADLCMDIKQNTHKILIGYSDITYLHTLFNQHFKMPSIHASTLVSLAGGQRAEFPHIISILNNEEQSIEIKSLNDIAKKGIEGELIGGNFTIFTTLIGTKLHPIVQDKILLLEEVREPGYRVARLFNHLNKASMLDGLKGIIFGDMIESDAFLKDALDNFIEENPSLPIYQIDGIGHGKNNRPIILGDKVKIKDNILNFTANF